MDTVEKAKWGSYEFTVYAMDGATWHDCPGLYVFAGRAPGNLWKAYYIGATASFQRQPPDGERWSEAKRLGATHVHAMTVLQADSRNDIERELIASQRPALNT
jgi:hypothetical protein